MKKNESRKYNPSLEGNGSSYEVSFEDIVEEDDELYFNNLSSNSKYLNYNDVEDAFCNGKNGSDRHSNCFFNSSEFVLWDNSCRLLEGHKEGRSGDHYVEIPHFVNGKYKLIVYRKITVGFD